MEEKEEAHLTDKASQAETKCQNCGAILHYTPGTTLLTCEYCGTENPIESDEEPIEELDFEAFLADFLAGKGNTETIRVIKCDACGSETAFNPHIVADACAFCGSPLQVKEAGTCEIIRPRSLLPFFLNHKQAFEAFQLWIKGLWFAPRDLKRFATQSEKLNGIYIPYWTFDADTFSEYSGMRGINYVVSQNYTTVENGKSVTRTRNVTKIHWYPVSGQVSQHFDDVLVTGTRSLPRKHITKLEPWYLNELVPFDEKFLSGFRAESYQVDLRDSYEESKRVMDAEIRENVRRHIGGNHQRILTLQVNHNNVTFKHILLPVWVSAFRYRSKAYRFLVNGQNGKVSGERPYSFWKIFFFVLTLLIIIGGIILLIQHYQKN